METTADYQFSSNSKYANVALSTLKADGSADYQKAIDLLNAAGTVTLPPSSLMAGVYASVDRNVGVWKAPANVALQGVVKATVAISDNKQAGLNVAVHVMGGQAAKNVILGGAAVKEHGDYLDDTLLKLMKEIYHCLKKKN